MHTPFHCYTGIYTDIYRNINMTYLFKEIHNHEAALFRVNKCTLYIISNMETFFKLFYTNLTKIYQIYFNIICDIHKTPSTVMLSWWFLLKIFRFVCVFCHMPIFWSDTQFVNQTVPKAVNWNKRTLKEHWYSKVG